MIEITQLISVFETVGIMVFAASGALVGVRKGMDIFGVCILGLTTACGGGILRDLILGNTPPAVFQDPAAALAAVLASLVMFLPALRHWLMHDQRRYDLFMLLLDSAGLGLFTVIGMRVAWSCQAQPSLYLEVFVGVITGVGGGLLRDIMAGNVPYIFAKHHIYACAALVGALACGLLKDITGEAAAMSIGAALIFIIRCLSAHYKWNLPEAHD